MNSIDSSPDGRILGLDFGHRRVGVAVSDPLFLMAHGRDTLHYQSKSELFRLLSEIIRSEKINKIVVGMPKNMNGSEGEMSKTVRSFITELENRVAIPIITWDERLTSKQADRVLSELGTRRRRRSGVVDKLAAQIILQSYLDMISTRK